MRSGARSASLTILLKMGGMLAISARRTLLTLDAVTDGPAELLYRSLGYVAAGVIPGYALNYDSSGVEATTVMYKDLNAV